MSGFFVKNILNVYLKSNKFCFKLSNAADKAL